MLSDSESLLLTLPGKVFRCKWRLLEIRHLNTEPFLKVLNLKASWGQLRLVLHSNIHQIVLVQLPICRSSCEGKRWINHRHAGVGSLP